MRMRLLPRTQFLLALAVMSLSSVVLLLALAVYKGGFYHTYLLWNLILAWIPFILAVWLVRFIKKNAWSSWRALLLSLAWLVFLPNSFYVISDFIHLVDIEPNDLLYSVVLFSMFTLSALALGFSSLYLVHLELRKRLGPNLSALWVAGILLLCSTAIFIGRDLRWNSWDIVFNPGGILFDVSDRIINPDMSQFFTVILPFFILLGSLYFMIWKACRMLIISGRGKNSHL